MKTTILFTTLCFLSCFSLKTHAQLDSIFVDSVFIADYTPPGDTVVQYAMAILTVHFDDISDLGSLSVVAYESVSHVVVGEFVKTRQELLDEGFLLPDHVVCPLFPTAQGYTYLLEINPQSINGYYSRMGFATLSN